MSQNAYAKVGHQQPASTGWTSPNTIYEKMRQVNVSASALNSDVNGNVTRQSFKASWSAWFANWSEFFKKYQGTAARFAALSYTDELFQQTLSYEGQLVTWYDAYGREKDGDKPVPPASGTPPLPNAPIPPSKTALPEAPTGEGLSIPWWAWVVGAGMLAGAGYMTYRYVKRAQAIRQILDEKVVPGVLQVYGGPAGNQLAAGYGQFAQATRDPGGYVMMPGANHMHAVQGGVTSVAPMPLPYARYGV